MNDFKRLVKGVIISFAVFSLSLLPLAAQSDVGNIKCTLKGVVKDRPQSSRLVLLKEGENMRFTQGISIPINDGEFEYTFYCDYEELYQLVFADENDQGAWRPIQFISEHGVVNFTLHPINQFDMNIVEGGVLNKEYWDFQIEGIRKQVNLMEEMNTKIEQLSKEITDIASVAKALQDSLMRELSLWILQYAEERPTIVGYSILVFAKDLFMPLNDISPIVNVYQTIFAANFPNHPYTAKMINFFRSSSLNAGVEFIDFTAVDFNGKTVKLSERIAGKLTVIHLWASWCIPCRQKGKELIPVYEEFRDKGFLVIGVARERGSSDAAEAAVKLDKYPWENFVELNDAEQIWEKYGIGNAAGSHFLIDEKGTIIAIAPSIEEIRDLLAKELK